MKKFFTEYWLIIFLVLGFSATIAAPFILSKLFLTTFKDTGPVGDTIGGITGPILNLLGLILIYLSFRHQFSETAKQQEERNEVLKTRHFEIIREYISQFNKNFDNVNFDEAWNALDTSFRQMQFGNYAQDWGEALHHNTTSDKVDELYREELGKLLTQTEDGRNYWHAINLAHYIIRRLKESERFHTEHQIFLINEFTLTYRITGLNYARRTRQLEESIKYKPYAERVFKNSQFYRKLSAIDTFCNQTIPGAEI